MDFESVFGAKASGSNSLDSEGDWFRFGRCRASPITSQCYAAQEQQIDRLQPVAQMCFG